MTQAVLDNRPPLIFGEILFDCFPDGTRVAGGAPFNVAWHLQGLGCAPWLISRIGEDPGGEEILHRARAWGLDTRGIQRDPERPTGQVQVTLNDGQPSFQIMADQAYDFIEGSAACEGVRGLSPALIYHGSLALRSPVAADALEGLIEAHPCPRFMDVNLRAPWWQLESLLAWLKRADIAKLNDQELIELSPPLSDADQDAMAVRMRSLFSLRQLILTCGAQGARVYTKEDQLSQAPAPVRGLIDTVGAGDAFSAVCILGHLRAWDAATTLERALAFAARICQQRGATADAPGLYEEFREVWGL